MPIRTQRHFEDMLVRSVRDPSTGLLSALRTGRRGRIHSRISISIRPASQYRHRQAARVLEVLNTSFPLRWLDDLYETNCTSPNLFRRWFAGLMRVVPRTKSATDFGDELDKLDRHLFEVCFAITVSAPKDADDQANRKLDEIVAAFGQFTSRRTRFKVYRRGRSLDDRRFRGSLLSSAELASIWHPTTANVRVARLQPASFRETEPPTFLPSKEREGGVTTLGRIKYRQQRDQFGIRLGDRRRHVFIPGKTGMGKTTLIGNMAASDIESGRGVCVIDPHGDLAETILHSIPKHRTNDVIYFDAGDKANPIAFNPLSPGKRNDPSLVADGTLSVFKKVFGFDEASAPRLLHILRNCLLALVSHSDATLISVDRMLDDAGYRRQILASVSNPAVQAFWNNQFNKWNERDRTQYIASLQNKLGAFLSNETLHAILGQSHGTIDLRRIMDERRIFIVNLSKGRVGEDAASLLGALLVSNLQIAAMSRADIPENDRCDFFAYVDEFQNFATESFATILSEARKYRLSMVLANQYLSQLKHTNVLDAVFGNVGSMITFQVGVDDAELLSQQLASDITPRDLMNLPKYHAYARLLIDGLPAAPFSLTTLEPTKTQRNNAETIRRISRERYSRPAERVKAEVDRQYVT